MRAFRDAVEARDVDRLLSLMTDDVVFRARVGDRGLEGCDFVHVDADGLVDELFVMVRPLSGAMALAEAVRAELERSTD